MYREMGGGLLLLKHEYSIMCNMIMLAIFVRLYAFEIKYILSSFPAKSNGMIMFYTHAILFFRHVMSVCSGDFM